MARRKRVDSNTVPLLSSSSATETADDPEKEKRRAKRARRLYHDRQFLVSLLAVVGTVIGVVAGVLVWRALILAGLFATKCPVGDDGTACNGLECMPAGFCNCTADPLLSGPSCSDNAIPGYSALGAVRCNGRGIASPFMRAQDVPTECQEETPSSANGHTRSGGWTTPACLNKLAELRDAIKSGTFDVEDVAGVPACEGYCDPGYGGEACEDTVCPQSITNAICSDRGLTTVGIFENDTDVGVGCQCASRVQPLSKFSALSLEQKERIRTKYAAQTLRGYCGTMLQSQTDPEIVVVYVPDATTAYKCFCQEKYYGVVCEYGVCPSDSEDNVCSGGGHEDFGFGAEKNTTRSTEGECEPRCADGYSRCPTDGRCVSDTRLCDYEKECPADAPWRCPSGHCAPSVPQQHVVDACGSLGYTWGWLDNPNNARGTPCNPFTPSNDSYVDSSIQNVTVESCAGSDATMTSDGFVPGGNILFESPLVFASMYVVSGTVAFTYRGTRYATDNSTGLKQWTFSESYDQVEERAFSDNQTVTVTKVDDGWSVVPVPWFVDDEQDFPAEHSLLRLTRSSNTEKAVLNTVSSFVRFDSTGAWGVANVTATTYRRPYGDIVSEEECFSKMRECVWNVNTSLSFDGARIVCQGSDGRAASVADDECVTSFTDLRPVVTGAFVQSRTSELNLDGQWTLQLREQDVSFSLTFEEADEAPTIRDVEWLTVANLTKPCVCLDININASYYDRQWITDARKTEPDEVGEYALARRYVDGDAVLVRGTTTRSSAPWFMSVLGFDDEIAVTDVKRINATEFRMGNPSCSRFVFPGKCPDGSCATLALNAAEDVSPTCDCGRTFNVTSCTCSDEFLTSFTCLCSTLESCSCSQGVGFEFETALASYVLASSNATCVVARVSAETSSNTTGTLVSGTNNTWDISSTNDTHPAFLREIVVEGVCDESVELSAKATPFSTTYWDVPFDWNCTDENNTRIFPSYSIEEVYDVWRVVTSVAPIGIWSPQGIPVGRVVSVEYSASSNADDAGLASRNGDDWWASSDTDHRAWLNATFNSTSRVVAVFVSFYSVGLRATTTTTLPVAVYLQASTKTTAPTRPSDWFTLTRITSDVVEGRYDVTHVLTTPRRLRHVRLYSHFPFSVREFIPLTDQSCTVELLLPDGYVPFVADTLALLGTRSSVLNESLASECVGVDSCTTFGYRAYQDGTCQDEKYLASVYDAKLTKTVVSTQTSAQIVLEYFNATGDATYAAVGDAHVWWSSSLASVPTTAEVATWNDTGLTLTVFENRTYLKTSSTYYAVTAVGTVSFFVDVKTYGPYIQWCETGTDVTDCGPSTRYGAKAPGYLCELTAEQEQIYNDTTNQTYFATRDSRSLSDLLDDGVPIAFEVTTLTRTHNVLSRTPCGDCDGRTACGDGTCAERPSDCPDTRYDCKGDGCVRVNPNTKEYWCACAKGRGGLACSTDECVSVDATTIQDLDPYLRCCNPGFPPLKRLPPASLVKPRKDYSSADVERMNKRVNGERTKRNRVFATFAPYGVILPRGITEGTDQLTTTCDYYVRGPMGQPLSYEDCVLTYNLDGTVAEWRTFETHTGSSATYAWTSGITHFDHFPFRCAKSGVCVAKSTDCDLADKLYPKCNGNGALLVDGTCRCAREWTTFLYTETFSSTVSIPYANDAGTTNPVTWNLPNTDGRDWGDHYCKARNCDVVDCSIPRGCFAGSKRLGFKDKHVSCPGTNKCAVDKQACTAGNTTEPLICSGNGVAKRRDYRSEEWYCECGTPKSRLIDLGDVNNTGVTDTTELLKNGWGGRACNHYHCQEDPSLIWYSRFDPKTRTFWKDRFGESLPGKWMGPCGAPVGPDPEDLELWKQCCPEENGQRMEQCVNTLCSFGGKKQCVPVDECVGGRRKPAVYPCNNKGLARADGTCDCESDPATGVGYTEDLTRFSYAGCFRRTTCALSRRTGTPCGREEPCGSMRRWIIPDDATYFTQQWPTLLAIMGFPITNKTLVMAVAGGVAQIERYKRGAYNTVALDVKAAVVKLTACVYVNGADEDASNPCCMLPYSDRTDTVFYERGFDSPYEIQERNSSVPYLDGKFFKKQNSRENYEHVSMTWEPGSVPEITLQFDDEYTVAAVRIYAYYAGSNDVAFEFEDDDGDDACGRLLVPQRDDFDWVGSDNAWYCVPTYLAYDFELLHPVEFSTNCGDDEFSTLCLNWKDELCPGVVQLPSELDVYYGCASSSRCCVAQTSAFTPTTSLTIKFKNLQTNSVNDTVKISEIKVLGYRGKTQNMTQILADEISTRDAGETCRDQKFMDYLLGQDTSMFVFRNWSVTNAPIGWKTRDEARQACLDAGGVLGTKSLLTIGVQQDDELGDACFVGTGESDGSAIVSASGHSGCHVSARNVNDSQVRPISDFILKACSTDGCWVGPDSGNEPSVASESRTSAVDAYSTPDQDVTKPSSQWGNRWKSPLRLTTKNKWTRSWYEFITAGFNRGERQKHMTLQKKGQDDEHVNYNYVTVYRRNLFYSPGVSGLFHNPGGSSAFRATVIPANTYTNRGYLGHQLRIKRFNYANNFFLFPGQASYSRTREFASLGRFNVGVAPKYQAWTNEDVCVIKLYWGPNCGTIQGPTPDSHYDPLTGTIKSRYVRSAHKTFVITPADDYDMVGRDFSCTPSSTNRETGCVTTTFDECPDGEKTCDGLGWTIPGNVRSVSVDGPCTLYGFTYRLYTANQPNFKFDGSTWTAPTTVAENMHSRYLPAGCFATCEDSSRTRNGNLCEGKFRNVFPRTAATTGLNFGFMEGFIAFTNFESSLVEVTVRAPFSHEVSDPTTYNMGIINNPYMCSNVKLKVLMTLQSAAREAHHLSWHRSHQLLWGETVRFSDGYVGVFESPKLLSMNVPMVVFGSSLVTETDLANWNTYGYSQPTSSTFPFAKCTETGREVLHCPVCPQEQGAVWEWEQGHFDFRSTTFVSDVDYVRQKTPLSSTGADPVIYTQNVLFVSFLTTNRKYFARQAAWWTDESYNRDFFLDNCLKVVKNEVAAAPRYYLETTPCYRKLPVVCNRDVTKYTIRNGMQGDVCGASSRIGPSPNPNATCYAVHELADSTKFPKQHAIKDAYEDGTLELKVAREDYDWDVAAAYLLNETTALLGAFASFWDRIDVDLRPGHVTDRYQPDSETWTAFDVKRTYPVSCGEVPSQDTGLSSYACAISDEYCSFENRQRGPLMKLSDYPGVLQGVPDDVDAKYETTCGTVISPNAYHVRDGFGGPAPDIDMRYVDDIPETLGGVQVVALKTNGTWRNTGKNSHQFVFELNRTVWVTGKIECTSCSMQMYVGTLNSEYSTPNSSVLVGSTTGGTKTYEFELTIAGPSVHTYQVLYWNLDDLVRDELVKLYPAIVTTTESIAQCRAFRVAPTWREPDTMIESGAPVNECPFTEQRRAELDAPAVGVCYCRDPAYGGPSCEDPAADTTRGKLVCSGFGDDVSRVHAPDGTVAEVNENGVFEYGFANFGCKCRDEGTLLKTRRIPATAFDYLFLFKSDKPRNSDNFDSVAVPSDITAPVDESEVDQVCASASGVVPALETGDRTDDYVALGIYPTFLDLALDANSGDLRWNNKGLPFASCSAVDACGYAETDPCADDDDACVALNWNNRAFNATGGFLVDGLDVAAVPSFSSFTVRILDPSAFGHTVIVWTEDESLVSNPMTATSGGQVCFVESPRTLPALHYTCNAASAGSVVFTQTPWESPSIREIQVYAQGDGGRNPFFEDV